MSKPRGSAAPRDLFESNRALTSAGAHVSSLERGAPGIPSQQAVERLAQQLERYRAELEERFGLDDPIALERAVRLLRAVETVQGAASPELRQAYAALSDPELTAEQRAAVYGAAGGAPLTDAVLQLMRAFQKLDSGWSWAGLGSAMDKLVRVGGENGAVNPLLARSPLAFVGKAGFEQSLGELDRVLGDADSPAARAATEKALNILRVVARTESDKLCRISARIPEEKRDRVLAAVLTYIAEVVAAVGHDLAAELADPVGAAVAGSAERVVAAGRRELHALGHAPRHASRPDLSALAGTLRQEAAQPLKMLKGEEAAEEAYARLSGLVRDESLRAQLEASRGRLQGALDSVEMTPDARTALREVLDDIGASARMTVSLVQLFGAASNPEMPEAGRMATIKTAVERMGPVFVKLMQTLANMQSLLNQISDGPTVAANDPVIRALKRLQDDVTPLPWPAIKAEIESSLGRPISEAFVWVDPQPFKCGSIGQIHRAKVRTEEGDVPVVLKVLRPDVRENFDNTVRITRLTLSVFRELLALDAQGDLLGDMKAAAEMYLPMVERALGGFIESFRIETDFAHEARNMRELARLVGPDRHVTVPLVYDSHTRGNVLTMQELRGFKLSEWLGRYRRAQAAPGTVEQRGAVQGPEGALERARAWVEEALGESAQAAVITRRGLGGYHARVETASGSRDLRVRSSGAIEPEGSLPPLDVKATEARIARWAERAFGLEVQKVELERHDGKHPKLAPEAAGWVATVLFAPGRQKSTQLLVRDSDRGLEPLTVVPDLTEEGIAELRDRLLSTFANQALRGLLHGDPHEGNFFILPDGKTIGLLDLGLVIRLGLHHARGPLRLLASTLLQRPRQMAEAIFGMSSAAGKVDAAERQAIIARLAEQYQLMLNELDTATAGQGGSARLGWVARAMTALRKSLEVALKKSGLMPSGEWLQVLKTTFSMAGNIASFEWSRLSRVKTALRTGRDFLLYQALGPLFGERLHLKKAKAAEQMSVLDARVAYGPEATVTPLRRDSSDGKS